MSIARRHALLALAGLPLAATAAPGGLPAVIDHDGGSPEWDRLRAKLFGDRPIATGADSAVQLVVPLRAAYGASVPVKIVPRLGDQAPGRAVRRYTLLVDKNPSPVAATLNIGPAIVRAEFETRLRVDEYGHMRVIAELDDGSLHLSSRYVKVSGGCSAPPNRDAPQLIGQTRFKLPEGLKPAGQATPGEVTVIHPNDTGFELNQVTVMYIPPHFVRSIRARYDGRLLFDLDCDFSISENPSWRFLFQPRADGGGRLEAEVEDSKEQRFRGALDLATGAIA
ncbi:quinoprotein dehydrogenase-associated SoxYZ-like carrier [Ideonella sp. 4Y16]|uniref:quinoprotein dehydrogenase-associated SoxYZ-like carrier n=1 Tax=Ideonella alba TaxID=2824118 RepID=UPI001B38D364|nr:quinoprotein dehydrogenase-associated SoxYZ-like carrier [Ideonella alba]MBQ0944813.1 quinoprotein dehydrogenase-associated SoxYZ-like carrier [Ideonella alba]